MQGDKRKKESEKIVIVQTSLLLNFINLFISNYKRYMKYSVIIIIFLLCGCLYSCKDSNKTKVSLEGNEFDTLEQSVSDDNVESKTDDKEEAALIYVYICGEVQNEGIYQVEEGARLYQVVELAGGILETAAEHYLNLAETVTDGQKIVVPSQEEASQLEEAGQESASSLINLNTAGEDALTTLPGIGSSKAKSIIAYRESKGGFQSIEELMEIEGIKEGVFYKIKDMITVK